MAQQPNRPDDKNGNLKDPAAQKNMGDRTSDSNSGVNSEQTGWQDDKYMNQRQPDQNRQREQTDIKNTGSRSERK